jgi:hypothetical protein
VTATESPQLPGLAMHLIATAVRQPSSAYVTHEREHRRDLPKKGFVADRVFT